MSFTEGNSHVATRQTLPSQLTTQEWEAAIGGQFRRLRIHAQLDQSALAGLASVSIGAVKNLEQGHGSSLKTIICIALALDREQWLESISPKITVSPIAVLRSGGGSRSRVYRSRAKKS